MSYRAVLFQVSMIAVLVTAFKGPLEACGYQSRPTHVLRTDDGQYFFNNEKSAKMTWDGR